MVTVAFSYQGLEIARLSVAYGQVVRREGDLSWLNFEDDFRPYSQTLKRAVSWQEDCEEWTRSLPGAYANSPLRASIVEDSPSTDSEIEDLELEANARKRARFKFSRGFYFVYAFVGTAIVVAAVAVFAGVITPSTPSAVPTFLASGPSTTLILPKAKNPQLLKTVQVKTLTAPLDELSVTYNHWLNQCIPLSRGRAITTALRTCMIPDLIQMNTLVNSERVSVRTLEKTISGGECDLALSGFDQQLYSFHLGLAQATNALSDTDEKELAQALSTIDATSSAVATSNKTDLPTVCL